MLWTIISFRITNSFDIHVFALCDGKLSKSLRPLSKVEDLLFIYLLFIFIIIIYLLFIIIIYYLLLLFIIIYFLDER